MYQDLFGIKYQFDKEQAIKDQEADQAKLSAQKNRNRNSQLHNTLKYIQIFAIALVPCVGFIAMVTKSFTSPWFLPAIIALCTVFCALQFYTLYVEVKTSKISQQSISSQYLEALKHEGLSDAKIRLADNGTAVLQLFFSTQLTTNEPHAQVCIGIKPIPIKQHRSHETILNINEGVLYVACTELVEAQNKCKTTFDEICTRYKRPIKSIDGSYLPTFIDKCHNHRVLMGRDVYLTSVNYKNALATLAHQKQRRELLNLIMDAQEYEYSLKQKTPSGEGVLEKVSAKYRGDLIGTYKNILKREREMGIVRVPCTFEYLDPGAEIYSNWSGGKINYSPLMTRTANCKDSHEAAMVLTDALLIPTETAVITINFGHIEIQRHEFVEIRKMIEEIINCFNDYFKAEYEIVKDNIDYQHRNDVQ